MVIEKSKVKETSGTRRTTSDFKVVAAIPCLNTAHTIYNIVTRALEYVDQIIVIDDGSTDNTAEVAVAAGATVISHGVNKGYGAAIKSCFAAAREYGADALVIVDGDGQHNPHEIPALLIPIINKKADLVIGSRFLNSKFKGQSLKSYPIPNYRRLGIGVITWLWNIGSKIKVSDAQSGFRACNKRLVNDLKLTEDGMSQSIEILEKIRKNKPVIKEVPITCSYENNNGHLTFKAACQGIYVALSVIKIRLKYMFVKRKNLNTSS